MFGIPYSFIFIYCQGFFGCMRDGIGCTKGVGQEISVIVTVILFEARIVNFWRSRLGLFDGNNYLLGVHGLYSDNLHGRCAHVRLQRT